MLQGVCDTPLKLLDQKNLSKLDSPIINHFLFLTMRTNKKLFAKGLFASFSLVFLLTLTHASAQTKDGWRQLFNGKDLNGWKHVGPGSRYVKNGVTGSHGGMGLEYWTQEKLHHSGGV
jgi:hypothetical protein